MKTKENTKPVTITLKPSVIEMAKNKSKETFYKSNLSGYLEMLIKKDNQ